MTGRGREVAGGANPVWGDRLGLQRREIVGRKSLVISAVERKNMNNFRGTRHAHRDGASADGDKYVDPICGMSVKRSNAAAIRADGGVEYFFCSTGCATAFDADHAH